MPPRVPPASLKTVVVQAASASEAALLDEFVPCVSRAGIFLPTAAAHPAGERVRFEVKLRGGSVALGGTGTVSWHRPRPSAFELPRPWGLGLKDAEFDLGRELVEALVRVSGAESSEPPDPSEPNERPPLSNLSWGDEIASDAPVVPAPLAAVPKIEPVARAAPRRKRELIENVAPGVFELNVTADEFEHAFTTYEPVIGRAPPSPKKDASATSELPVPLPAPARVTETVLDLSAEGPLPLPAPSKRAKPSIAASEPTKAAKKPADAGAISRAEAATTTALTRDDDAAIPLPATTHAAAVPPMVAKNPERDDGSAIPLPAPNKDPKQAASTKAAGAPPAVAKHARPDDDSPIPLPAPTASAKPAESTDATNAAGDAAAVAKHVPADDGSAIPLPAPNRLAKHAVSTGPINEPDAPAAVPGSASRDEGSSAPLPAPSKALKKAASTDAMAPTDAPVAVAKPANRDVGSTSALPAPSQETKPSSAWAGLTSAPAAPTSPAKTPGENGPAIPLPAPSKQSRQPSVPAGSPTAEPGPTASTRPAQPPGASVERTSAGKGPPTAAREPAREVGPAVARPEPASEPKSNSAAGVAVHEPRVGPLEATTSPASAPAVGSQPGPTESDRPLKADPGLGSLDAAVPSIRPIGSIPAQHVRPGGDDGAPPIVSAHSDTRARDIPASAPARPVPRESARHSLDGAPTAVAAPAASSIRSKSDDDVSSRPAVAAHIGPAATATPAPRESARDVLTDARPNEATAWAPKPSAAGAPAAIPSERGAREDVAPAAGRFEYLEPRVSARSPEPIAPSPAPPPGHYAPTLTSAQAPAAFASRSPAARSPVSVSEPSFTPTQTRATPSHPAGLSAIELARRAFEARCRGDHVSAETDLQWAIALEPSNPHLRLELGLLYSSWSGPAGSHEVPAEAALARAVELDGSSEVALVSLAEVQLRRGLHAAARNHFTAALERNRQSPRAKAGLEALDALRFRRRVRATSPLAAVVVLSLAASGWLARAPRQRSAPADMMVAAATAPAPTPTVLNLSPESLAQLAAVMRASVPPAAAAPRESAPPPAAAPASPPSALASAAQATSSHSDNRHRARTTTHGSTDHQANNGLASLVKDGDAALRAGRVDDALAAYKKAIATDANYAPAHRGLGSVFVMQGKDAEAKAAYQKYLSLAPNASDAPRIQGLLQDM